VNGVYKCGGMLTSRPTPARKGRGEPATKLALPACKPVNQGNTAISNSKKEDIVNRAKEQVRKAIFGKLRNLRRKLISVGVPCGYSRSVLSGTGFKITYEPGNNGDVSLLPKISIRNGEAVEEFDVASFETGLARVKELFQVQQ
jgi:hypothetical protein